MNEPANQKREYRSDSRRKLFSNAFSVICLLVSSLAIVILATLLISVFVTGGSWLNWEFLTASHRENNPEGSGIGQAIIGSLVICSICGIVALPIGIGTAIFLEEFQPRNRILRMFHGLVQLNINNLAGVPSIVYGILGLTAFVYMFGAFHSIRVNGQPDYEIGATYYYQTKTLSGEYVKFPAVANLQPAFEIQNSVSGTDESGRSFRVNLVSSTQDKSEYENKTDSTVFHGTIANLIEQDGNSLYQANTVDGATFTFSAKPTYSQFAKILGPIEVVGAAGKTFTLNVLSKSDPIPTDDLIKSQSVFADSADPKKRSSASIFRENSFFHMHLPFSKSVLSAGLTLALVILPIVIIASQEAIRGVPQTLREAAFGMGATRWQVVRGAVLPSAIPGIMTGAILAMSRAVGEAAPLLAVMGGVLGTTNQLSSLMDKTPVLPVTIFKWAGDENQGFEHLSAAAIIILLLILLMMNSIAIMIRYRYEKKLGT
ncbi:MAG: phosphate transport system permease protein [Mariniblastus sp.]|jgi:phosphate transport system permease protein